MSSVSSVYREGTSLRIQSTGILAHGWIVYNYIKSQQDFLPHTLHTVVTLPLPKPKQAPRSLMTTNTFTPSVTRSHWEDWNLTGQQQAENHFGICLTRLSNPRVLRAGKAYSPRSLCPLYNFACTSSTCCLRSYQLPYLNKHEPGLIITPPLVTFLVVNTSHHGQPEESAAMKTHAQQALMLLESARCVSRRSPHALVSPGHLWA